MSSSIKSKKPLFVFAVNDIVLPVQPPCVVRGNEPPLPVKKILFVFALAVVGKSP